MSRYQNVWILIVIVFGTIALSAAKYGDDCVTEGSERSGKCVPVKSCNGSLNLLIKLNQFGEQNFQEEIVALQQSKCDSIDGIPHVCCPTEGIQMNPVVLEHLKKLNCGSSIVARVSKGAPAGLYSFRWMALLKYSGNERFDCGGALIDDRHVLTAAHCLKNFEDIPIAVRIGEYDLNNEIDCLMYGKRLRCLDAVQDIGIEKIMVHENYVYKEFHDDIALLRLDRAVNLKTKSVNPICLPINEALQKNLPEQFMVSGWGLTEFGNRSNILLWTAVPNQSHDFCKDALGIPLTEQHICAGGKQFQDSCRGDSGGPLFYPNIYEDGVSRSIQYGIVSVGARQCGQVSVPAVYISIPYYMQWITDHMKVEGYDF